MTASWSKGHTRDNPSYLVPVTSVEKVACNIESSDPFLVVITETTRSVGHHAYEIAFATR